MDAVIREKAIGLPSAQKLELIADLWDSMDANQLPVTAEQAAELDRRLSKVDRATRWIPWSELRKEAERRNP